MDLNPSFTAAIDLESECEDDMTIPMKLDFNQNSNNVIEDVGNSLNNADGGSTDIVGHSLDNNASQSTDNNNVNQTSCTRSGLVYK